MNTRSPKQGIDKISLTEKCPVLPFSLMHTFLKGLANVEV
jgi:hypothetical protein